MKFSRTCMLAMLRGWVLYRRKVCVNQSCNMYTVHIFSSSESLGHLLFRVYKTVLVNEIITGKTLLSVCESSQHEQTKETVELNLQ